MIFSIIFIASRCFPARCKNPRTMQDIFRSHFFSLHFPFFFFFYYFPRRLQSRWPAFVVVFRDKERRPARALEERYKACAFQAFFVPWPVTKSVLTLLSPTRVFPENEKHPKNIRTDGDTNFPRFESNRAALSKVLSREKIKKLVWQVNGGKSVDFTAAFSQLENWIFILSRGGKSRKITPIEGERSRY